GSTLRHRDRFLYGGAVTLEVDAYLTDRIILSLTGRERILWGTTTGHFHAQFGLGVKFIIH
ncbi:conjugal transfer protein TraO, partial [Bacteroides ovatus]